MKTNRKNSRFHDYSAKLAKKYGAGAGQSTAVSETDKDNTAPRLPVKVRLKQRSRRDRITDRQKPSGNAPDRRNDRIT